MERKGWKGDQQRTGHTESRGQREGCGYWDRGQEAEVTIRIGPLSCRMHFSILFPELISFYLEQCAGFGNAWKTPIESEDCSSHWGSPTLLLPHEQVIFILECKILCKNSWFTGPRISCLSFERDNVMEWKESWTAIDSTQPLTSGVILWHSISLDLNVLNWKMAHQILRSFLALKWYSIWSYLSSAYRFYSALATALTKHSMMGPHLPLRLCLLLFFPSIQWPGLPEVFTVTLYSGLCTCHSVCRNACSLTPSS